MEISFSSNEKPPPRTFDIIVSWRAAFDVDTFVTRNNAISPLRYVYKTFIKKKKITEKILIKKTRLGIQTKHNNLLKRMRLHARSSLDLSDSISANITLPIYYNIL